MQPFNRVTWNRRQFLQWTGGSAALLALSACAPAPAQPTQSTNAVSPGQPQRGGTLRLAFPDAFYQFDPAFNSGYANEAALVMIYEQLVRIDMSDPTFTLQPMLAESWTTSEDGLTWTFALRQGVQFHHGAGLSAQDVVYTYERILDPALGSPARTLLNNVASVAAVDELSVRIQLTAPDFSFIYKLRWAPLSILPRDRSAEQLATAPSGTGPFTFVAHDPSTSMTFARNPNYWEADLPYLDEVRHLYLPESATQIAGLTSDTLDVVTQLGVENIAALANNPAVKVHQGLASTYMVFAMRVDQEPFTDVRVRQALKLVVDRPGLVQGVLQGYGVVGNDQPIPPGNPYAADLPAPTRDIEQAKALLTAAGYPDGLSLTLYTAEVGPNLVAASVAFQEMAKAAGISVQIERVSADVYWTEHYLQQAFFVDFWSFFPEPDEYMVFGFDVGAPYDDGNWHPPELAALIQAGRGERDVAKRQAIYTQLQQLISREGGILVPYFQPLYAATGGAVQAYTAELVPQVRATWLAQP